MSDDFCLLHGYEHMQRTATGGPIAFCEACLLEAAGHNNPMTQSPDSPRKDVEERLPDLFFETIAALLLAYDDEEHGEPLYLAESLRRIVEWKHLPHEGDCSKAQRQGPWTCSRCVADRRIMRAKQFFDFMPSAMAQSLKHEPEKTKDTLLQSAQERIGALEKERDAWKLECDRAGVCMSCATGRLQEPCTDCLCTGWRMGAPHGFVDEVVFAEAQARIAELEKPVTDEEVTQWTTPLDFVGPSGTQLTQAAAEGINKLIRRLSRQSKSNDLLGKCEEALKEARHRLVCLQGLYATDIHPENREALIANGSQIEFQIDDADALNQIDAILSQIESKATEAKETR